MSRIRLGNLLLPQPMSLSFAVSVATNLAKAVAENPEALENRVNPFALIADEQLAIDTLASSMLYMFAASGEDTLEYLAYHDYQPLSTPVPTPANNLFMTTLDDRYRKFCDPVDFRAVRGMSIAFVNKVRHRIRSAEGEGKVSPAFALSWSSCFGEFIQWLSSLGTDVEAHAPFAFAFIEPLMAVNGLRVNATVARAFLSLGNHLAALEEFATELATGEEPSTSPDDDVDVAPAVGAVAIQEGTPEPNGWKLYSSADVSRAIKAIPKPKKGGIMAEASQPTPRQALLEKLAAESPVRTVVQLPENANLLEGMYDRFPHFSPVLDYIKSHFALYGSGSAGAPVQFPPILVRGTPGIGKTFFGQCLAELLGVHFEERDLSIMSDSMVIVGGNSTFKDSAPGLVFETLASKGHANPLILLNEIDKCSDVQRQHRNPVSALYSLLEKRSAKAWTDEFVGVAIDTSRVNWVLTANDGVVPEPILSRVKVFDIRNPTVEEQKGIVRYIWKDLVSQEFPPESGFGLDLSDEVCTFGASISNRRLVKLFLEAAGVAVLNDRRGLVKADLDVVLARDKTETTRPAGFLG